MDFNYNVQLTSEAENDLDNFVYYLWFNLENPQAAKHLIDDFEKTKEKLSTVAASINFCENPKLAALGYRKFNFLKMKYFMLYRIEGNNVVVDNIFHQLQDYENKLI